MKTITITLTIPDDVQVTGANVVTQQMGSTPAQNGPGQAYVPVGAPSGATPVCPKHGAEKVKPSTKGPGFFCTAHDDSGPRGYCQWSVK